MKLIVMDFTLEWMDIDPIDAEQKRYLALNYLGKIKEEFENKRIVPALEGLVKTTEDMRQYIYRVKEENKDELDVYSLDLETLALTPGNYGKMNDKFRFASKILPHFQRAVIFGANQKAKALRDAKISLLNSGNKNFGCVLIMYTNGEQVVPYLCQDSSITLDGKDKKMKLFFPFDEIITSGNLIKDSKRILDEHTTGEDLPVFIVRADNWDLHDTLIPLTRSEISKEISNHNTKKAA